MPVPFRDGLNRRKLLLDFSKLRLSMKLNLKRSGAMALAALSLVACSTAPNVFRQGQAPNNFQSFSSSRGLPMQTVSLRWQNKAQVVQAATAGIDLFGAQPANRIARARVTPQQQEFLRSIGMQVANIIEARMEERGGLLPGYMTYAQMSEKLQAMAQQYPQIVNLEVVGETIKKNKIWAITIGNKQTRNPNKPSLMLTAGIHARELAPVELVMKLANELTAGYGKDPQITQLVDTRDTILLPMVNVDGRLEVEKGDSWKRKNMNLTRGSGVDINRNFNTHWNYQGLNAPSSWLNGLTSPNSETYSGASPASEPETQAVQNMYKRRKITMSMDIHSYSEMFFWPRGYSEQPIPEVNTFKTIYQNTFAKNRYDGGTSLELLYPTSGTSDDYGYDECGTYSMGLEVGQSFRPSYPEVEQMWTATRNNWLYMINAAGTVPQIPYRCQ